MLLSHKMQLWPTADQVTYFRQACGSRRHAYNQLLAHFKQDDVKWSKAEGHRYFMDTIRPQFLWYSEVSARVTRNAVVDLDTAFAHFFRRVKLGQRGPSKTNPFGFPAFKKKGGDESFSLREAPKFDVDGRWLRIEKLKTKIKMRQRLRFDGKTKAVTISERAGRWYASILVETGDYDCKEGARQTSVGVDLGIKRLATLSDGTKFPANQSLKANIRRLVRRNRNLATKTDRSSRRAAKAKLSAARLHYRIACQRAAATHAVSDYVTRTFDLVTIEDLNVTGMLKNRRLARAVADAGMGMTRQQIRYKSALRRNHLVEADRWHPSSKTCSSCGTVNEFVVLGVDDWTCLGCETKHDRDDNASKNLDKYGLDTLTLDLKRTQEDGKTMPRYSASADGVKMAAISANEAC